MKHSSVRWDGVFLEFGCCVTDSLPFLSAVAILEVFYVVPHDMSLGILFALASMVMWTVTNTIQEYIANNRATTSLVWQYCALVGIAAIAVLLTDGFALATPTPLFFVLLALVGVIWYTWIRFLFESLRRLDLGITMLIASTYVFFGYFVNWFLYPEIEVFSVTKVVVAVLFFVILGMFLLHKNTTTQRIEISRSFLYPLGTAVCRTIFFVVLNVFMKQWFLTAFQWTFYTEGAILVVAVMHQLVVKKSLQKILVPVPRSIIRAYIARWIANFSMGVLGNFAYSLEAANTVNIVKLFSIVLSALFGYIFFRQVLQRKQIILMSVAFVLLIVFVVR